MNIHESAEDYLEKILMLQEQKGSVRSIDIFRWTRTVSSSWSSPVWRLHSASMAATAS